MGTILLSPQDCLSSPHNRQNYSFRSAWRPETSSRCSQALMAPLPAAEDCARHDYNGGSPPGDGLLPIPQPHGQARVLAKRSPLPIKTPSSFCTPPARRSAAASLSTVKPKLSRSSSAILPTPLAQSPPILEVDGSHLLKGRLPFKIVHENGPSNNKIDAVQRSNSKKHIDLRNGSHKKMDGASGYPVHTKVKGHVDGHQGSRSKLKPPHDGAAAKGLTKKFDARNQRSLERSHSMKGAYEKHTQEVGMPVVTILQRPQNEEAAAELLTKFFQKTVEQNAMRESKEGVDYMSENLQNSHEMTMESEMECQSSIGGSSDFEGVEDRSGQTIASLCRETDVVGAVVKKHVRGSPLANVVRLTASSTVVTQSDVGSLSASKGSVEDLILESVNEELASWERWAGPSYINSPPPSALPLPRFSRKLLKDESSAAADLSDEIVSDQASTPPSSISPVHAYLSGQQLLGINLDVVAFATKDLKRMLNLELSRM